MFRLNTRTFVLAITCVAVACGGSSAPSAPTTPTPPASTAPTITGVSSGSLTAQTTLQTLTISGTNFQPGLSITVTPPVGLAVVLTGGSIQALTSTSFRVTTASIFGAGTYLFKVTNTNGESSNAFSATATSTGPTFVAEGPRLTEVTAGFPGQSIADSSIIQLRDGRWRMLFAGGTQIRSAISPDGLSMTMEPGIRIDPTVIGPIALVGSVKLLRLDDGRIRAYFNSAGGMRSAVSSDEGTTFVFDPGIRLSASAIGDNAISGGSVVRLPDGRWRMYFSGSLVQNVFSATSSDLLTWSLDAGARIGSAATVSGSAAHPSAILNANGSVSIFYFRQPGQATVSGLYTATSADGLNFATESPTGIQSGNDPDVVSMGGTIRMYYSWGDDNDGTINSARLVGSLTSLGLVWR